MKKTLLLLLASCGALLLTSCNYIKFIISDSSISSSQGKSSTYIPPISSYTSVDTSSTWYTSSIPTSVSEKKTLEKQTLKYTIKDYENNNFYSIDSMPSLNNPKLLVLPIYFADSSNYVSSSEKITLKTKIQKAFFSETGETGWESVKSYYYQDSFTNCNISGEVADWYSTTYRYSDFTRMTDQSGQSSSWINDIVKKAVNSWKSNKTSEEIKAYDTDSNGYIDGVVCVYAGPNYTNAKKKSFNYSENMWAYTYWLQSGTSKDFNSPNPNAYMWASYDFMEKDCTNGVNIDTHTYIHESGHLLGLDDLYDYNDIMGTNPCGSFSMQDLNLGQHDPYSGLALGWVKPYVPTESCSIEIGTYEETGDLILLTPEYSGSPFDEYILIELYSPTGLNQHDSNFLYCNSKSYCKGPQKVGIRMWHVDARLFKMSGSSVAGTSTDIVDGNKYVFANTNTTYSQGYESYCSKDPAFYNFKLNQLIRKGDFEGQKLSSQAIDEDLFVTGDTFEINHYPKYFINGTRFNNGKTLSWSVAFNSVTDTSAVITLTKH